jgi:hypothetical protein
MMGVDDVRSRHRREQGWRDRIRRVAAQPANGAQRAAQQSTRLALEARDPTESDELAVDGSGQGTRQFERIAFAAAE